MPVYIGLATTFHDPAIAIVGGDGAILFAEGAERYLQYKRAPNSEPDTLMRMSSLLRDHCDPADEVVVATSWGERFTTIMGQLAERNFFDFETIRKSGPELGPSLVPEDADRAFQSLLYGSQRTAGLGVLLGLKEAFGHTRMTIRRYPHHLTHAAYACYTSPFTEAACLIVDGMGEFGSIAFYRYADGRIEELMMHRGHESVGYFYGLITDLCGFDQVRGEEWKVMGLAPYGSPDTDLLELIRRLYGLDEGRLSFANKAVIRETVDELRARAGGRGASPLDNADIACAGQHAFAEITTAILRRLEGMDISRNLAYGGGCALNSSYNGTILANTSFERLYVPSAPADDGNALGAALLAYHEDHPDTPPTAGVQTPYLGSPMSSAPVERMLRMGWPGRVRRLAGDVHRVTARLLADGKLVGWARGRAEFGPRALGNRSILADPRPADTKDRVNEKVKLREPFRPFAPSILHEHGPAYFEDYQESPYMERTLKFREEAARTVPGVVHVDRTGRLQTVKKEWNPEFHALVAAFHDLTGVPLVLNTSFNIMGRPMIHTAEDAITMLCTTGLDAVVIEDYLIEK